MISQTHADKLLITYIYEFSDNFDIILFKAYSLSAK